MNIVNGLGEAPARKRTNQMFLSAVTLFLGACGMASRASAPVQDLSTAFTAMDAPPTTWTACTLISRPELEETIGVPLRDGQARLRGDAASSCLFDGNFGGRVVVLVRHVPNGIWKFEQVQRMEGAAREGTFRDVPGIGDRAFLFDRNAAGAAMCVLHGDYYLQISVFGLGGTADVSPTVETLARRAVGRF